MCPIAMPTRGVGKRQEWTRWNPLEVLSYAQQLCVRFNTPLEEVGANTTAVAAVAIAAIVTAFSKRRNFKARATEAFALAAAAATALAAAAATATSLAKIAISGGGGGGFLCQWYKG